MVCLLKIGFEKDKFCCNKLCYWILSHHDLFVAVLSNIRWDSFKLICFLGCPAVFGTFQFAVTLPRGGVCLICIILSSWAKLQVFRGQRQAQERQDPCINICRFWKSYVTFYMTQGATIKTQGIPKQSKNVTTKGQWSSPDAFQSTRCLDQENE